MQFNILHTSSEEESEADALRACNDELRNKLAETEQQRMALLEMVGLHASLDEPPGRHKMTS